MKILLTVLLMAVISPVIGQDSPEVKTEDIYIYAGEDFAEVVKTTLFVDKSLLIKQFFDKVKHGAGILLLAPQKYGKSTNMNMIKRFYQINLDENGRLVDVERTFNYNLFKNNYLKIYQIKDFFHKNFGKYPVIHIDYNTLVKIQTVEELLGMFFRLIIMETFLQHKYLLNDPYIWLLNETYSWVDKEKFKKYLDLNLSHKLTETDIQTGLSFLAKLLHKRFERRVVVLIDNYDAFVDSPLFSQNSNIFHFISAVNCDLLRCESVERSLITGVPRPSGPSVPRGEILPSNVVDCGQHHGFWQYYGLSGQELDALLEPFVADYDERQKVVGKIVHSYSGYGVATFEAGENSEGQLLDSQGCSVWSVIQYMEKELNVENFSSLV